MNYLKSIIVILSLSISFLACDRDRNNPLPSEWENIFLKNFQVEFSPNNQKLFSIVDSNGFRQAFELKIGSPLFGTLSKGPTAGSYYYLSNGKYVGSDSLIYEIREGAKIKSGKVWFKVSASDCFMNPHSDKFNNILLDDTLFLPIISNDTSYCPNAHVASLAALSIGHGFVHNNVAALILPAFYKGDVTFKYEMSNGVQSKMTPVELTVNYDQAYCDRNFRVRPDSFQFSGNTLIISFSSLLLNDGYCPEFADENNITISSTTVGTNGFQALIIGHDIIVNNISTSINKGEFEYTLCTNSGTCQTAKISLLRQ